MTGGPAMSAAVELIRVGKSFPGVRALREVDLCLPVRLLIPYAACGFA
jgi:hypothetical protein